MTTKAYVICPTGKPHLDVAIHLRSDGMPSMLGRALAQICLQIEYTFKAPRNDPDMIKRGALGDSLSATIMGRLYQHWDEIHTCDLSIGGENITWRSRGSHNQFQVLPAQLMDTDDVPYTYRLTFKRDDSSTPVRKRIWIELEGVDVYAGWPEQMLSWLDEHHPED